MTYTEFKCSFLLFLRVCYMSVTATLDISNIPIKSDNSFVLPFQPTPFMPTFLRIVFDYYIVVLPVLEVK